MGQSGGSTRVWCPDPLKTALAGKETCKSLEQPVLCSEGFVGKMGRACPGLEWLKVYPNPSTNTHYTKLSLTPLLGTKPLLCLMR